MRLPSIKTIAAAFPSADAKKIRIALETGADNLWFYASVTPALDTISQLIGGYGTEFIVPRNSARAHLAYINMGDTYDATVCFDYRRQRFFIGSWGDWVERNDPNGTKY